jgi:hypothetical protein
MIQFYSKWSEWKNEIHEPGFSEPEYCQLYGVSRPSLARWRDPFLFKYLPLYCSVLFDLFAIEHPMSMPELRPSSAHYSSPTHLGPSTLRSRITCVIIQLAVRYCQICGEPNDAEEEALQPPDEINDRNCYNSLIRTFTGPPIK